MREVYGAKVDAMIFKVTSWFSDHFLNVNASYIFVGLVDVCSTINSSPPPLQNNLNFFYRNKFYVNWTVLYELQGRARKKRLECRTLLRGPGPWPHFGRRSSFWSMQYPKEDRVRGPSWLILKNLSENWWKRKKIVSALTLLIPILMIVLKFNYLNTIKRHVMSNSMATPPSFNVKLLCLIWQRLHLYLKRSYHFSLHNRYRPQLSAMMVPVWLVAKP